MDLDHRGLDIGLSIDRGRPTERPEGVREFRRFAWLLQELPRRLQDARIFALGKSTAAVLRGRGRFLTERRRRVGGLQRPIASDAKFPTNPGDDGIRIVQILSRGEADVRKPAAEQVVDGSAGDTQETGYGAGTDESRRSVCFHAAILPGHLGGDGPCVALRAGSMQRMHPVNLPAGKGGVGEMEDHFGANLGETWPSTRWTWLRVEVDL